MALRIEAEDFKFESGGTVEVIKKIAASGGRAVKGFGEESSAHTLGWKIHVSTAGEYVCSLRYCTASNQVTLAVLVDGAAPSEDACHIELPSTGGWSSQRDDWKDLQLGTGERHPLKFPLTTGDHEIRLTNPNGALNLDALIFTGSGS